MSNILTISAFIFFVLLIFLLFAYVLRQKADAREQIYREAMRQESEGNYEDAVALYNQFLEVSGNKKPHGDINLEEVELRVATLNFLLKNRS